MRSKVDTTPHDLTEGILRCIDQAASLLGIDRSGLLRQTDVVRLSTTVATNALINRSGAKVGLLVGSDLYESIVSRLPETLPLARNLVEKLPSPKAAEAAAATVAALRGLLERGARIVVIALADGPDLAARELAVRTFIAAEYPRHYLGAVPIVPSHEVTLSPDPFLRVATAVLDAYLHPVMSRFLYRVEDELRRAARLGRCSSRSRTAARRGSRRRRRSAPGDRARRAASRGRRRSPASSASRRSSRSTSAGRAATSRSSSTGAGATRSSRRSTVSRSRCRSSSSSRSASAAARSRRSRVASWWSGREAPARSPGPPPSGSVAPTRR